MTSVVKKSGEREPFSQKKYQSALQRAGVSGEHIEKITQEITEHIYDGIPTTKLYAITFDVLKSYDRTCASKYSLKESLRELGPTGFPFERLVARLFEHKGHKTTRDQTLSGTCITHELDVIAYDKNICKLVECKFSNDMGDRMSVHVPMYMKSRFDDIFDANKTWQSKPIGTYSQCWIVTNAKVSYQSIDFSRCKNIHLLGWDHPQGKNLEQELERYALYPVTALMQLSRNEAHQLIKKGYVICKDILDQNPSAQELGMPENRYNAVRDECKNLCT
jgi:Holliday junction resolvase-like predicted endonuclease